MKRVTYRGVGLFANGGQINRANAFGATGTLSKEEVFELANDRAVEIVEDSPEVSMTIDVSEYGSLDTLALLAGKDPAVANRIDFSKDFEFSSVPIWNYVKANAESETLFTQFMPACVLTGYSANFSTDGNATESFTLVSDNKKWLVNEGAYAVKLELENAGSEDWMIGLEAESFIISEFLEVVYNNRRLSASEYDFDSEKTTITIPGSGAVKDKVYVIASGKPSGAVSSLDEKLRKQLEFTPHLPDEDNHVSTIKRRGHIEVYLFPQHDPDSKFKVTPAQSASIDANLSREDIPALGYKRFYDRPLTLPIDVTASIDVIFTDLELFAQLVGKDSKSATSLSLDNFRNDLGLLIEIYDRTDVDSGGRNIVKTLEIPQLIPTDEAWNISLDGQATQTFSFRGTELIAKRGYV